MTKLICEFEVEGYCQPKQRTFGNRFITPPETRDYEKKVRTLAKVAMQGKAPHKGFIGLQIEIICECPKSWTKKRKQWALEGTIFPTHCDIDNNIKSLSDAMNRIVYEDDRFISYLQVRREYGLKDTVFIKVIGS